MHSVSARGIQQVSATAPCSPHSLKHSVKTERVLFPSPGISKAYVDRCVRSIKASIREVAVSSAPADSSSGVGQSYAEVQASPVRADDGCIAPAPAKPGIYAFYNKEGELQYIGLSRKASKEQNRKI